MVARKSQPAQRKARQSMAKPSAAPAPAAQPVPVAEMKAKIEMAGRKLQVAGNAAGRFARSSMREVTGAAKASREPVQALWRAMRLAGRHIARDAKAAWCEVMPPSAAKKPARAAHRATA
jgi:hypothetical protein